MSRSKPNQEIPCWQEIGSSCLAVRMRVLTRAVTAIYDETVRKHGVTVPQLNLLTCTASFGEARPSKISEALHMDHTTTSRNVDRLIKSGLLEYVPDTDGRARPFRVSRKGKRIMEKIMPDWRIAQEKAKEFLGEQTVDAVSSRVSQLWSAGTDS